MNPWLLLGILVWLYILSVLKKFTCQPTSSLWVALDSFSF